VHRPEAYAPSTIHRDTAASQFTITAPQAEAFSGFTGGKVVTLPHLRIAGQTGDFATVIAVALDDKPLAESSRILVSRTNMDERGRDIKDLPVAVSGLRHGNWKMQIIRPRATAETLKDLHGSADIPLKTENGILNLPKSGWNQALIVR